MRMQLLVIGLNTDVLAMASISSLAFFHAGSSSSAVSPGLLHVSECAEFAVGVDCVQYFAIMVELRTPLVSCSVIDDADYGQTWRHKGATHL